MSAQRLDRVRAAMQSSSTDALLLSFGFDLPWLTGYRAMPLERLTMLVVTQTGRPTLLVPKLEAPRVEPRDYFDVVGWADNEDPLDLVTGLLGQSLGTGAKSIAISDQSWAATLAGLQQRIDSTKWHMSSQLLAAIRAVKEPAEIEALAKAGAAADRVAEQIRAGTIRFTGRTESEVATDIARRLRDEGHQSIDFVIVAAGPNSASPHHEPTDRVIEVGDAVVCDFGGTLDGYCSDTTRTFFAGEASSKQKRVYEIVHEAQQLGFEAAKCDAPARDVDAVARRVIEQAGHGEHFIHRLGHGIGVETHEAPYLVETNTAPLVAGNVFSIEPGIYLPNEFGVRIEDIVVATKDGPRRLNQSSRDLTIVP